MFKSHCIKRIIIVLLMSVCLVLPVSAGRKTLDPDSGPWTVEINAPVASVSVSGMAQPFSSVQVTAVFICQNGQTSESRFPVNVMFLTKAKLMPQKENCQVKELSFVCTRGKVDIEAWPASGSGGVSGDYW